MISKLSEELIQILAITSARKSRHSAGEVADGANGRLLRSSLLMMLKNDNERIRRLRLLQEQRALPIRIGNDYVVKGLYGEEKVRCLFGMDNGDVNFDGQRSLNSR